MVIHLVATDMDDEHPLLLGPKVAPCVTVPLVTRCAAHACAYYESAHVTGSIKAIKSVCCLEALQASGVTAHAPGQAFGRHGAEALLPNPQIVFGSFWHSAADPAKQLGPGKRSAASLPKARRLRNIQHCNKQLAAGMYEL